MLNMKERLGCKNGKDRKVSERRKSDSERRKEQRGSVRLEEKSGRQRGLYWLFEGAPGVGVVWPPGGIPYSSRR